MRNMIGEFFSKSRNLFLRLLGAIFFAFFIASSGAVMAKEDSRSSGKKPGSPPKQIRPSKSPKPGPIPSLSIIQRRAKQTVQKGKQEIKRRQPSLGRHPVVQRTAERPSAPGKRLSRQVSPKGKHRLPPNRRNRLLRP